MQQTRRILVEYVVNYDDSDTLCNQFERLIEMHLEYIEKAKPDISAKARVSFNGIGSVEWEIDEEHREEQIQSDLMQ